MHKKIPKFFTGCRVRAAKICLYHSTKIAKARPHSEECQTDSSVQKQWSMGWSTETPNIEFTCGPFSNILPFFCQPASFKIFLMCWKMKDGETLIKLSNFAGRCKEMVFFYQNCSDLLWEKNVLVIQKNFRNSRLKAKHLQNFWAH